MVGELADARRIDPDFRAIERPGLEQWLEFHRVTLLLKCEGLDADELKRRVIPTSKLTLHGLVRHMAEVERNWFQRVLSQNGAPPIWFDPEIDDSELEPLDDADFDSDCATWLAECESSRAAAAGRSLDDIGVRRGNDVSLRWIYNHMIEEYARHNGHADLIRELIDGAVGD